MTSTILATAFMLCWIQAPVADRLVEVDLDGVIRWRDDHGEVAMFGVNYYAPFAADHEGLTLLGEDHRKVIDRDVAHLHDRALRRIRGVLPGSIG
jgi:hypothetical protein